MISILPQLKKYTIAFPAREKYFKKDFLSNFLNWYKPKKSGKKRNVSESIDNILYGV